MGNASTVERKSDSGTESRELSRSDLGFDGDQASVALYDLGQDDAVALVGNLDDGVWRVSGESG